MNKEITKYASTSSDSLLYKSKPEELIEFSLNALATEFETELPTLMSVITKLSKKKNSDNRCVAATIISKILGISNQRLSAYRYVNGLILNSGGAKDVCMSRFHRTGDCVAPRTLRPKMSAMSSLTSRLTRDWDATRSESSIVYDNVNPYVKPRHQTSTKGNKLYSMTHCLMMKDRVPTAHLSATPALELEQLKPSHVLPCESDKNCLDESFIRILCNVWSEHVPSLSWMKQDIPKHKHSRYTNQKTEFVSCMFMTNIL